MFIDHAVPVDFKVDRNKTKRITADEYERLNDETRRYVTGSGNTAAEHRIVHTDAGYISVYKAENDKAFATWIADEFTVKAVVVDRDGNYFADIAAGERVLRDGSGGLGGADSGLGGLGAFVAQSATGTVEGLLLVVGSEHTEDDGHLLRGVKDGAALCGIVAHIVEVGSAASNHASYHYHGVKLAATRHQRCREGEFHSSRNSLHGDAFPAITFLHDALDGSVEQWVGDLVVPPGSHNAHLEPFHMRKFNGDVVM